MISIIIALIVLAILAVFLIFLSGEVNSFLCFSLGVISAILAATGLIFYAFLGWNYMAAEYKADIINREYGTNYTQAEVYWAADVIDTVRELDRKRVELNGDLFREEK